jgi:hypothetical protein
MKQCDVLFVCCASKSNKRNQYRRSECCSIHLSNVNGTTAADHASDPFDHCYR